MAGLLNITWFLCVLVFFIEVTQGWSVWSDPELAAIEPKAKKQNQEPTVVDNNRGMRTPDPTLDEMKIAIGKLMFVSGMQNFKLPPGERRSVSLTMNLNDMDLDDINTFLKNPNQMNMMKVAKVMQRSFSPHRSTAREDSWFKDEKTIIESKQKWVQIIFNLIMSCTNKETMLVLTCLIMAVFIVRSMIFGADIRVVIGLFFVAVFFAGFLWNWSYMYQKAVVDQFVKQQQYSQYASGCKPEGGFWSFVKGLFGYGKPTLDECTEYYRATNIDPLIMVPPTIALSETLSMFVIHPAILMAESMQKITRILFGNQLWGMYFGTPLVMIIFGGMFVFMFIMLTGRRIKFQIMYVGSFEVGSQFENYVHHLPSSRKEQIEQRCKHEELADKTTSPSKPSSNANRNTENNRNTETNSNTEPSRNTQSNGNTESNRNTETNRNTQTNTPSTHPCSSNPTTASQIPSTSRVGHSCVSPCVPTWPMANCFSGQPLVQYQPVSCQPHMHSGVFSTGCQLHSSPKADPIWGRTSRHLLQDNPFDSFRNVSSEGPRSRMSPLGDVTNQWANVDSVGNLRQRRNLTNRDKEFEDTFVMYRRRKLSI